MYNFITKLKNILKEKGFQHQDRMGLHSEVLNNNKETEEIFLQRVSLLEGRKINVKDASNYDIVGKSVALMLDDLDGYDKDAKITIAYFSEKSPEDALKIILENI